MKMEIKRRGKPRKQERRSAERAAEALREAVLYEAANTAFEDIQNNIPKGRRWAQYRKSLRLARIAGMGKGQSGYIIYVQMPKRVLTKDDAYDTVVYIYVNNRTLTKVDPKFKVLESYNPWTMDTLPIDPAGVRGVRVVSRKVRKREVANVAKMRERERSKWSQALSKYGWRATNDYGATVRAVSGRRGLRSKVNLDTEADLAFEVSRVERGLSTSDARPHWAPGVKQGRAAAKAVSKSKLTSHILAQSRSRDKVLRKVRGVPTMTAGNTDRYGQFEDIVNKST